MTARHLHLAVCSCTEIGEGLTIALGCALHDSLMTDAPLIAELRKLAER